MIDCDEVIADKDSGECDHAFLVISDDSGIHVLNCDKCGYSAGKINLIGL